MTDARNRYVYRKILSELRKAGKTTAEEITIRLARENRLLSKALTTRKTSNFLRIAHRHGEVDRELVSPTSSLHRWWCK